MDLRIDELLLKDILLSQALSQSKTVQPESRSMRSFPDFESKSLTKHWSDFFTYHGLFAILYFRGFYTILHFPKPCIAAHKNSNYPKGIKLCKECEYFVMEGGEPDPRLYLFRILNKAVAVGVTSVFILHQYYAELVKIFLILSAGLVSGP